MIVKRVLKKWLNFSQIQMLIWPSASRKPLWYSWTSLLVSVILMVVVMVWWWWCDGVDGVDDGVDDDVDGGVDDDVDGGGVWSTGAQLSTSPWQTGNVQIDVGDQFRLGLDSPTFGSGVQRPLYQYLKILPLCMVVTKSIYSYPDFGPSGLFSPNFSKDLHLEGKPTDGPKFPISSVSLDRKLISMFLIFHTFCKSYS